MTKQYAIQNQNMLCAICGGAGGKKCYRGRIVCDECLEFISGL